MVHDGRPVTLAALNGNTTSRVPVGPLTWGFEYYWKVAGIEPWQLACGSEDQWLHAHLALLDRHNPDFLFYSGGGTGSSVPRLVENTDRTWIVQDGNTGRRFSIIKSSLTEQDADTGRKSNEAIGAIRTQDDADRLIPPQRGWDTSFLKVLEDLIDAAGDRCLILPHHSPGYVCACFAFGFSDAMTTMIENPGLFTYVADSYAAGDELRMKQLRRAGAEAVYIADGWASVDIISPAMFREFALPYQKSMVDAAHAAGLKAILWNEGDVMPLLQDEASLPIDGFAIEQPRKGIDLSLAKVREVFGPSRCLFGNLDSEHLLQTGNAEMIGSSVRRIIAESGHDAPLIMCTGSPLPSATPPEAVDCMIGAARDAPGG